MVSWRNHMASQHVTTSVEYGTKVTRFSKNAIWEVVPISQIKIGNCMSVKVIRIFVNKTTLRYSKLREQLSIRTRASSLYRGGLSRYRIFIIKIRRSWDYLICIKGIAIAVRRPLYIETGPRLFFKNGPIYNRHVVHSNIARTITIVSGTDCCLMTLDHYLDQLSSLKPKAVRLMVFNICVKKLIPKRRNCPWFHQSLYTKKNSVNWTSYGTMHTWRNYVYSLRKHIIECTHSVIVYQLMMNGLFIQPPDVSIYVHLYINDAIWFKEIVNKIISRKFSLSRTVIHGKLFRTARQTKGSPVPHV